MTSEGGLPDDEWEEEEEPDGIGPRMYMLRDIMGSYIWDYREEVRGDEYRRALARASNLLGLALEAEVSAPVRSGDSYVSNARMVVSFRGESLVFTARGISFDRCAAVRDAGYMLFESAGLVSAPEPVCDGWDLKLP